MLGNKDALATIAVKDLKAAAGFYQDTLGLKKEDSEGDQAITYVSGRSRVIVYQSEYAGTNKATAANWVVGDDLESIVKGLGEKGVAFEHYDMPGITRNGDIHIAGDLKVAWFKDPDGNILSLIG
jgi:catechol 2,3-dioxygenase-like lactoylglutathione lyase family enzyme